VLVVTPRQHPRPTTVGSPIRTLVVDDDYRVASMHTAYINRIDGFVTVGQAHSAVETLQAVDEMHPALVLIDVYLPDGDGLGVMRKLLERPARPDFIVISAARDLSTVRTAMQLGAVHYLIKPFSFTALDERLTSYSALQTRIAGLGPDTDQTQVDQLFGEAHGPVTTVNAPPPKGHSAPTLSLVRNTVKQASGDMSAAEVALTIGISRATAQRYLSYLASHGLIRRQMRYGATGRPEHRYTSRS
jgi:response regulator of citrate/malate metabolism